MIIYILFCINTLTAQNMREVLQSMPDSILPMFTRNDRLDFIDFVDNSMKAEVKTRFGDVAEMTVLAEDFCHIKTSEVSSFEIKLLNLGEIICIVNSIKQDGWDSSLSFFNNKWECLKSEDFFTIPHLSSFIPHPEGMDNSVYQNLLNRADIPYFFIQMNAESQDLRITYSSSAVKDHDYDSLLKPYIHPELYLHWNGKAFVEN